MAASPAIGSDWEVLPAPTGDWEVVPTAAGQVPAAPKVQLHPTIQSYVSDPTLDGMRFKVTSTTGDQHNPGSRHYRGEAFDVVPEDGHDWDHLITSLRRRGFIVRDERAHPAGQRIWTGSHIHVEINPAAQAMPKYNPTPSMRAETQRLLNQGLIGRLEAFEQKQYEYLTKPVIAIDPKTGKEYESFASGASQVYAEGMLGGGFTGVMGAAAGEIAGVVGRGVAARLPGAALKAAQAMTRDLLAQDATHALESVSTELPPGVRTFTSPGSEYRRSIGAQPQPVAPGLMSEYQRSILASGRAAEAPGGPAATTVPSIWTKQSGALENHLVAQQVLEPKVPIAHPADAVKAVLSDEDAALSNYVSRSQAAKSQGGVKKLFAPLIRKVRSYGAGGNEAARQLVDYRYRWTQTSGQIAREAKALPQLNEIEKGLFTQVMKGQKTWAEVSEALINVGESPTDALEAVDRLRAAVDYFKNQFDVVIPKDVAAAKLHRIAKDGTVSTWQPKLEYVPEKMDWRKIDRLAFAAQSGDPAAKSAWADFLKRFGEMNQLTPDRIPSFLNELRYFHLSPSEVFSAFQHERGGIHIPIDVRMDPVEASVRHLLDVRKRIAAAATFGIEREKWVSATQDILTSHGEAAVKEAAQAFDIQTGLERLPFSASSGFLSWLNDLTLVATANPRWLLKHAPQVLNLGPITGFKNFWRASVFTRTVEGKAFLDRLAPALERSSALSIWDVPDSSLARFGEEATRFSREGATQAGQRALESVYSTTAKITEKVTPYTSFGLPKYMRWMQEFAASIGREFAEHDLLPTLQGQPSTYAKLKNITPNQAVQFFKDAGVDIVQVLKGGDPKAIQEALDQIGWHISVDKSIFSGGALNYPAGARTEVGQTVMLLRRFAYRSMDQFWNDVAKKVTADRAGAIRVSEALLGMMVGGEVKQWMLNGLSNTIDHVFNQMGLTTYEEYQKYYKQRPDNLALRVFDDFISGFPMIDLSVNILENSKSPIQMKERLLEEVVGPTIGKALDIVAQLRTSAKRYAAGTRSVPELLQPVAREQLHQYLPLLNLAPPPVQQRLLEHMLPNPPSGGPGLRLPTIGR